MFDPQNMKVAVVIMWFAVNNRMLDADYSDVMLIGTFAQLPAANQISENVWSLAQI